MCSEVCGQCGGCTYRDVSYEVEFAEKCRNVAARLGIANTDDIDKIPAPTTRRYRNTAQFKHCAAGYGFYKPRTHETVSLTPQGGCDIVSDIFLQIAACVHTDYPAPPPQLRIRQGHYGGEINVSLLYDDSAVSPDFRAARSLTAAFPQIVGVVHRRKNKDIVPAGRDYIIDNGIRLNHAAFCQVNTPVAELMYDRIAAYADCTDVDVIYDMFCGSGGIGLGTARRSRGVRIYGVESEVSAVRDAEYNAAVLGVNAEYVCGTFPRVKLPPVAAGKSAVVFDPPRAGVPEQTLLDTVRVIAPRRIVMVSCNPVTLARDCGVLAERGYRRTAVTVADMFPRTAHVEAVVLMTEEK